MLTIVHDRAHLHPNKTHTASGAAVTLSRSPSTPYAGSKKPLPHNFPHPSTLTPRHGKALMKQHHTNYSQPSQP
ncbi:hypothetical protein, partial [Acetobacter senegalensis]|uniref:hypothetical protein n=1 Tax=Acetobacter senegalensis TaxID=446692 RepID=UPI001B8044C1